jgi:prevent-host-death family protein
MQETRVGIRDLKAHLSEFMRQVRLGETIVITDHGKAVARILPLEEDLQNQIEYLRAAGLIAWNGKKLNPISSPVVNQGDILVSDLVVEMRE